jgi:hypothetical protein
MKTMPPHQGWLLKLSTGLCKYYGLFLMGLLSVSLLSTVLGIFPIVEMVWSATGVWLVRVLVFAITSLATSIVFESWRC